MPRHRRRAKQLNPIVVTGIFSVVVAIISTVGIILAAVISKQSPAPPISMPPTVSRPSTAPSAPRSSFRSTAVQSSSPAATPHQSETPAKPTPNPAPTLSQQVPVQMPDASPTSSSSPTASTMYTGPPVISILADFAGCSNGFCPAPLSLTLAPIVLENGMPITDDGCEVNWTIRGSSLPYETSTPCSGDFRTGLVLEVGTYQIIAEVITSSGTVASASFSLLVENSPTTGEPVLTWSLEISRNRLPMLTGHRLRSSVLLSQSRNQVD